MNRKFYEKNKKINYKIRLIEKKKEAMNIKIKFLTF